MTTSDILKRYRADNHFKVESGNAESFEPLLPFDLMDTVYQLWCKRVQSMPAAVQQERATHNLFGHPTRRNNTTIWMSFMKF